MRKILLVDDDEIFSGYMANFLKQRGCETKTAVTLKEAKQIIEKEMPLLVCSDFNLPDGSCLELLDMVRTFDPARPFLVISDDEVFGQIKPVFMRVCGTSIQILQQNCNKFTTYNAR